ncbi:MAG: ParB/RepB/Spo0J family partition protein [Robiginitomaculum sp.]
MSKPPKKPTSKKPARLGRGLSALMSDISPAIEQKKPTKKLATKQVKSESGVQTIAINHIECNPDQPRRHFDKKALAELSQSIKDKGVLQPILLRPLPKSMAGKGKTVNNRYQIVAGERRWQAALAAKLDQIPALVRNLSDREILEVGVVENVQREDLNPIEEALAYGALKQQFGRRQKDIAQAIGKSRAYVANRMRLLDLPERAREYLAAGKITPGHANAILSYQDPMELTELIVTKNMSVRDAEKWARFGLRGPAPETKSANQKDANIRALEDKLSSYIGLQVSINHKGQGGKLSINYKTPDQLEAVIKRLNNS